MAGQIIRSRHIGAGQYGKSVDELLTNGRRRQITPIDQQVTINIECLAPAPDLFRRGVESRLIERAVTDPDRTVAAVGDDVHRVQLPESGQDVPDLGNAVTVGFEQHHLDLAVVVLAGEQIVQQLLIVGGGRIDEDQFTAQPVAVIRPYQRVVFGFIEQVGSDSIGLHLQMIIRIRIRLRLQRNAAIQQCLNRVVGTGPVDGCAKQIGGEEQFGFERLDKGICAIPGLLLLF